MLICSNVGGDGAGVESIKEIEMYIDNSMRKINSKNKIYTKLHEIYGLVYLKDCRR